MLVMQARKKINFLTFILLTKKTGRTTVNDRLNF